MTSTLRSSTAQLRRRKAVTVPTRTVDDLPVIEVDGPYVQFGKPALDRVIALLALVVLLPIMIIVAVTVFISLGRPVILRQDRVGKGGKIFSVFKFRSMHADRRRGQGPFHGGDRRLTHKSEDDPRLTPVGRFIRRLSLDEIPQLINVLRGEMSIVGPRPELPQIVDSHYEFWHHRRHAVKPGMTGLWQVSERGSGVMYEHVDIDLDYVDSISLRSDVRIILRTVPAALVTNQGS